MSRSRFLSIKGIFLAGLLTAVFALVSTTLTAHAIPGIPKCGAGAPDGAPRECTTQDVFDGIRGVTNYLIGLSGSIALVYLVIGGFEYVSSAGDKTLASSAKATVWHAAFGLILTLGAWVLIQGTIFIITLTTLQSSTGGSL